MKEDRVCWCIPTAVQVFSSGGSNQTYLKHQNYRFCISYFDYFELVIGNSAQLKRRMKNNLFNNVCSQKLPWTTLIVIGTAVN